MSDTIQQTPVRRSTDGVNSTPLSTLTNNTTVAVPGFTVPTLGGTVSPFPMASTAGYQVGDWVGVIGFGHFIITSLTSGNAAKYPDDSAAGDWQENTHSGQPVLVGTQIVPTSIRDTTAPSPDLFYSVEQDSSAGVVIPHDIGKISANAPITGFAWHANAWMRATTADDKGAALSDCKFDSNGNWFTCGGFKGTLELGDGVVYSSTGGNTTHDGFVAKYSPSGVLLKKFIFGGTFEDNAYGLAIDSGNNVIVVGAFGSPLTIGGVTLPFTGGTSDILVIKFNSDLVPLWSKAYGTISDEWATAVAVDGSDNIFVVGKTGYAALNFGGGSHGGTGSSNGFVVKLKPDGSWLWDKRFTASTVNDFGRAFCISVDANGNAAIGGGFVGTIDFGDGPVSGSSPVGNGFVVSYGSTGNLRWKTIASIASSDASVSGMACDPVSGDWFICGGFTGTLTWNPLSLTSNSGGTVYVGRLASTTGNAKWLIKAGGATSQIAGAFGIAYNAANQMLAITGAADGFLSMSGGPFMLCGGGPSYWIVMLHADSSWLWQTNVSTVTQYGKSVAFTPAGTLLAGGYGANADLGGGLPSPPAYADSGFVVQYNPTH